MKVAIISDIHGNMQALEAVLDDINKKHVDSIICLGDMIGKGPNSKEVVDLCKEACRIIVKGNWESFLYNHFVKFKAKTTYSDHEQKNKWYHEHLGNERLEYLNALPHSAELFMSGKLVRLFHAHPLNFNRYYSTSPEENRLELFGYDENNTICKRNSDIAIYADIHSVYMQELDNRLLLNVGSVGNPLDMTMASYVILEGDGSKDIVSSLSVQFIRVPYDIENAVSVAKNSDMPDLEEYITEITTATYCRRK